MKKFKNLSKILVLFILLFSFGKIVNADEDDVYAHVNVYINGELSEEIDIVSSDPQYQYMGLEYGTLSTYDILGEPDIVASEYGTLVDATARVNGYKGYITYFDISTGTTFFVMKPNYDIGQYVYLEAGDQVVLNMYFEKETGEEPEIVYGTAEFKVFDLSHNQTNPAKDYTITINGKKGTKTQDVIVTTDAEGHAITTELDTSYTWTYKINDSTFPVDFDEENYYYNEVMVVLDDTEEEYDITGTINIFYDGELFKTKDITSNSQDTLRSGKIYPGIVTNDKNGNALAVYDHATVTLNGVDCNVTSNGTPIIFTTTDGSAIDGELIANIYYTSTEYARTTTYKINVSYYFNSDTTSMTDGIPDAEDTIKAYEETIETTARTNLSMRNDILNSNVSNYTVVENEIGKTLVLEYDGDEYTLGAVYMAGGSGSNFEGSVHNYTTGEEASTQLIDRTFKMLNSDIVITLCFRLRYPHYSVTINYLDIETDDFVRDIETGEVLVPNAIRTNPDTPRVNIPGTTNRMGPKYYDVSGNGDKTQGGYASLNSMHYYFVKQTGDGLTGELNSDKVVNLYYTNKSKVIVYYVDKDNNLILKDKNGKDIENGKEIIGIFGTEFETEPLNIYGYRNIDKESTSEETIFTEDVIEIYYIYDEIIYGELEVLYVDMNGDEIAPSLTDKQEVGTEYKTEPIEIPGYSMQYFIGDEEGIYTEDPITVIYVYDKNIGYGDEETEIIPEEEPTEEKNPEVEEMPPQTGVENNGTIIPLLGLLGLLTIFKRKNITIE